MSSEPIVPPLEPVKTTPELQLEPALSTDAYLSTQFSNIMEKIDTLPGQHVALLLEKLQDDLLERKGFSAVLRQIRMSIGPLKSKMNLLNTTEKEELRTKMSFWRTKLKIKLFLSLFPF